MRRSIVYALLAAALFGASTPVAKLLVGQMSPILLAGVLYLGSGIGLIFIRLLRDRGWRPSGLNRREWPWLLAAIAFGGILGPVILLVGLALTSASSASLLLNLEAVLTAVIAWVIFKENADRRVVLGMVAIVCGSLVLAWPAEQVDSGSWLGALLVATACLCWAIDNNLTRKVSAQDALFIAASKGLVAGLFNTGLALAWLMLPDTNLVSAPAPGAMLPSVPILLATALLGLVGYGISLVLFVLALRGLGAARTGAYFSTAPFIGAGLSLLLLQESTSEWFWLAVALMAIGVWLHLTERHSHRHTHDVLRHSHSHYHDEHHRHQHAFDWDGTEPHEHTHTHAAITHSHPHYPDIHHRHKH